jgi:hypothetical protein
MTIDDLLKSRGAGLHFNSLLLLTEPCAAYPGKTPAPRVGILRHLQTLELQTQDRLNTSVSQIRDGSYFETFSQEESYMLRQRLLCALDFLSRLADSLPTPEWLSTASAQLELEDAWLLVGVWREFGPFWLQNLAWRISRGATD